MLICSFGNCPLSNAFRHLCLRKLHIVRMYQELVAMLSSVYLRKLSCVRLILSIFGTCSYIFEMCDTASISQRFLKFSSIKAYNPHIEPKVSPSGFTWDVSNMFLEDFMISFNKANSIFTLYHKKPGSSKS